MDEPVCLRVLEHADLSKTHEWINTPEINELMGCLPVNKNQQERWFNETIDNRTKIIFAICEKETSEHIGNVGLSNIDYINRNAMISIFIAESKNRSKGAGFHSMLQVMKFAFHRLNMNKVYLKTSDYLVDAISFYKGMGFNEEGILRRHEYKKGRFVDKHLFSMLRDEYEERYGE